MKPYLLLLLLLAAACVFSLGCGGPSVSKDPAVGVDQPASKKADPAVNVDEPASDIDNAVADADEPIGNVEEPVADAEDPVADVDDPVVNVDSSNVEMKKAIKTARRTFDHFVKNWKSMPNNSVSVKFALPTNDGELEHIWFKPTKITATEITGICGNEPAKVDGLKYGDTRTFKRSKLTDWMILKGDKCYGGYTIRVLVKMQPENAPPFEFVDF